MVQTLLILIQLDHDEIRDAILNFNFPFENGKKIIIHVTTTVSTSKLIIVVAYFCQSNMDSTTAHDHREFLHKVYLRLQTIGTIL